MLKDVINKNNLTKIQNDFLDYLVKCDIYKLENDKYILTIFGKQLSDEHDYLHGNGEFYHERGDY